jgi:hypothetical protein
MKLDMVDSHVRRLDDDLEKYERELAAAISDSGKSKSRKRPAAETNTGISIFFF